MTESKWERLKGYVESINDLDGEVVKETILNQMDYMETIDDDGTPIKYVGGETMESLKKCPFCGSEDIFIGPNSETEEIEGLECSECFSVVCNGCEASSGFFLSEEKAVKAWNMRNVK